MTAGSGFFPGFSMFTAKGWRSACQDRRLLRFAQGLIRSLMSGRGCVSAITIREAIGRSMLIELR